MAEFPELRADVEDEVNRGLVHCEVGALAQFVQAAKGRASYLGERSIGHQDPGATSTALIISALEQAIAEEK